MSAFDPTRWRVPLGFAMAAVFLILARPSSASLAAGMALAALGVALRAYASGHIRKNDQLAVGGPYRWTRNPLYLGSLLLAAGFLLAAARWELLVLALFFYWLVYAPVIRREEEFLALRFGPAFVAYAERVPRLWPNLRAAAPAGAAASRFSWDLYRRHREYQALLGFLAMVLVLWLKYRLALPAPGW